VSAPAASAVRREPLAYDARMDVVDPALEAYASEHTTAPPSYLAELADDVTANLSFPGMMVGRLEGRFLELLTFALDATAVLEIGTFGGYSALSMAAGLAPGGRITTLELSPEHAAFARRHIARSPYADRIEVLEGPAIETIAGLEGPFDLVFIDADKAGYPAYFEAALARLAPRGIIAIDNTLWSGRLLDPADSSEDTVALRRFNDDLAADPRVVVVQTTVRDGVTLVRRAD
jgi:predicted O-methyltransferase YrrM